MRVEAVVITFLEQILCDTSDLVATKKRINDYAKVLLFRRPRHFMYLFWFYIGYQ